MSVRLGDGDGGFRAADDVPVGTGPTNLVLADYDADRSGDLACALRRRPGQRALRLRPPTLAGNLLADGGFEGAGAAGVFTQAPPIPGWERSGGITFARYGLTSHAFSPARLASPRYGTGGASLLWAATARQQTASRRRRASTCRPRGGDLTPSSTQPVRVPWRAPRSTSIAARRNPWAIRRDARVVRDRPGYGNRAHPDHAAAPGELAAAPRHAPVPGDATSTDDDKTSRRPWRTTSG